MAKKRTSSIKNLVCENLFMTVMICVLLVGGVAAFLISTSSIHNPFTVSGENTSTLLEEFNDDASGEKIEKTVWVKNTGDVACYVRVFAEITDPDIREKVESIDINTTDWTEKQNDGYYYYKKLLKSGEETTPLFTTITLNEEIHTGWEQFQMICYSETIAGDAESAIEAFSK